MVRVRSRSPLLQKGEGGRWLLQSIGRWNGLSVALCMVLGLMMLLSSLNVSFLDKGMSSQKSSTMDIHYESTNDAQCRFYIAESALPHSGLGVFTTIPLAKGDMSQSMPDICIYVADTPKRGTHFETHSWSRDAWYGTWEGGNPRAACEGVATLFNSMPPGIQTSKLHMLHPPDHGEIRRSRDPNAGALTHYTGISSVATRNVVAGSEITIDYQDWPYSKHLKYVAPTRSVDWIRKHGMCIDNIRIDTASDPTMGRGAFATRALSAGTRIAPAPIQVFADRSVFAQQVPEAQFINYCFAIGKLLLFPYGPGVNLINHASAEEANVRVQWSRHSMHHGTWLDLPLPQFLQMDYPGGIIMDVIALRDIEEGEELFMDYGPAWEEAWQRHLEQWKPSDLSYVYPQDVDTKKQPFRTIEEQKKEPYADNLATVCWTNNWTRDKGKKMKWTRPKTFDWPEGVTFCHIVSRTKEKGEYLYEVALHFEVDNPGNPDNRDYIDTHVPHSAIALVDKPYRSDLHLKNAFRQPLELPADMIPTQWLDAVNEIGSK